MWNKKDFLGNEVTWYSEEEYKELEEKLANYEEMLYNVYKVCGNKHINLEHYFYGALRAENLLDKFYKRKEKEDGV